MTFLASTTRPRIPESRTAALERAKALFGPSAWVRVNERISSPERRAAAVEAGAAVEARMREIAAEIARREEASGITALRQQGLALKQQKDRCFRDGHYCRFELGTASGSFALVRGKGDTWAEAFADAESWHTGGTTR